MSATGSPSTNVTGNGIPDTSADPSGEPRLERHRTMTIVAIAAICHAANAELCRQFGDYSQPEWAAAPEWQLTSAVNGVRAIAAGEVTTPQQSHQGWSQEKLDAGWTYGPVKDPEAKRHPCLVPFDALPPDQRAKDHLFFSIATTLLAL